MASSTSEMTILLGSGCFWSKEYYLSKLPGVIATRVGFAGGTTEHPTYRQVCHKNTGHAEVVAVTYDPAVLSTKALLRTFFTLHDPRIDRRGKGGQYRSIILYNTDVQKADAQWWLDRLRQAGHTVYTELVAAGAFWPAEERHQGYCNVRGLTPKRSKGIFADEQLEL